MQGDPLDRPIFVVAPPRSGARLLAGALRLVPGLWTPGSGALLSGLPELDPPDGRRAGRLAAADCTPRLLQRLRAGLQMAYALAPRATPRRAPPRLYDASPRNALIVPFLHRAFPDATFVYVHRRPLDALAESLAMWRAGNAATYPELPGWRGPRWSFLLVPGWADLIGLPLAEVVTEQWARTMRTLIADLEALAPQRWCVTDRDALLANPGAELRRLLGFLGLRSATAAAALVEPELSELDAVTVDAARAELGPYIARAAGLVEHARDWSAAPGS